MNWNHRITDAREKRGLSKAEFARQCGVSSPTVTDWESGKIKNLDAANMLTVCRVLDVDPWWLIFGAGKPPKREGLSPLSAVAQELIQCVVRLDGLDDQVRKTFAPIVGLLKVAEDLRRAQHSDVTPELMEQEALLASQLGTTGVAKHAPRKHK